MKIKLVRILALLCFTLIFNSCKKEAGEGGNASITGSVKIEDWNSTLTVKNYEYTGVDIDVYIVYGDGPGYDDKTKTDYKGVFNFKYLRKGKYTIYTYSKEKISTVPFATGAVAQTKEVEIAAKKGSVDVGVFTLKD